MLIFTQLLKGRVQSEIFVLCVSLPSIYKETVKKWGKLWFGLWGFSFASAERGGRGGYSSFVAPSLHSHQVPSENKELYFLPQATIWHQNWRFWLLIRGSSLHTAHTESQLCSTSALFCHWEHIPKSGFTHQRLLAKCDFQTLGCFYELPWDGGYGTRHTCLFVCMREG